MERTIENVRRVRSLVSNAFIIIIIIVGFGVLITTFQTEKLEIGIELGEGVIGIATLFLAYATFYLAFSEMEEGIRNREQAETEAKNERRRLRIKEQLDELYSPIVAYMNLIIDKSQHTYREGEIMPLMEKIRSKYEYLAEPKLQKLLQEYYRFNKVTISSQEWQDFIAKFTQTIIDDFKKLTEEYNELTE
jgi:hypothetical protein